ncbi:hypothetical protein EMIHUDRAFT_251036 [Emiliania huxleyi CCMP1516]|uniref:Uncharacterized protein n=2 Tax=Emiliania huxleyi TaxID=2903 RepID=A0A0D3KYE8_EMIH1|nr:hypothetical protein EMIHUDRAFT_251036 [Emiliania huxleyi CCMP1516]EOD40783.1 hypothetical protein EMIHUDRAFT_251036 [Emiliania huxleyi CCMP1516]|eukprot:XP_005793212.1 hypothetical protein EMIHUDRAFT_251036 [Emiliania huxleyi CCMP1516]
MWPQEEPPAGLRRTPGGVALRAGLRPRTYLTARYLSDRSESLAWVANSSSNDIMTCWFMLNSFAFDSFVFATYPTLEHDDHDPGPLAERIRRDKRERSDRSSDDSSSDRDSCGTGSTSEANDIFDTLEDHLGYGSDSGSGW